MHHESSTITGHDHSGRILLDGLDDCSHLSCAAERVRRHLPSEVLDRQVRDVTLEALHVLLVAGLVEAGDRSSSFVAWELDPSETLARIAREWVGSDLDLAPGAVCWLANTESGDELGEAIWQRDVRPLLRQGDGS